MVVVINNSNTSNTALEGIVLDLLRTNLLMLDMLQGLQEQLEDIQEQLDEMKK